MRTIKTQSVRPFVASFVLLGYFTLLFFYVPLPLSEEIDPYATIESKIKELRRKIETTKKQKNAMIKKIKFDRLAFEKYTRQYDDLFFRQRAELDSLKSDFSRLQAKTDSITHYIVKVKNTYREFDLQQKSFTQNLLHSCEEVKKALTLLPPYTTDAHISAITFLHSELSVYAVDNSEALERLWQIITAVSEGAQTIEIFPGQSPVSFVLGQVDFIRLGYAYCAFVNEKGTAGAIWTPSNDSLGGSWQEVANPQHILALKKCVAIRQGNSVPEIVAVPFLHRIHPDQSSEKRGEQ